MPWVRIDDHFNEHPKHARAGPLGTALWLAGLAYANRNLTDGFIPWATARQLVCWEYLDTPDGEERQQRLTIAIGSPPDNPHEDDIIYACAVIPEMVIDLLVYSGLWELRDGGYYIHDYDQYQPSRAQVLKERREARGRMQQVRRERRTNTARSSDDVAAEQ